MTKRRPPRHFRGSDTRAVSTQIGYILTIGIIAILMAGLISSTSGLVVQTTDQGIEAELQIIGDRIAAQVMTADRILAADGESTTVVLDADIPERISEQSYAISHVDSELVLESTISDIIVSIPLQTNRDVVIDSSQTSEWRIYNDGEQIKIGSEEDAPR